MITNKSHIISCQWLTILINNILKCLRFQSRKIFKREFNKGIKCHYPSITFKRSTRALRLQSAVYSFDIRRSSVQDYNRKTWVRWVQVPTCTTCTIYKPCESYKSYRIVLLLKYPVFYIGASIIRNHYILYTYVSRACILIRILNCMYKIQIILKKI